MSTLYDSKWASPGVPQTSATASTSILEDKTNTSSVLSGAAPTFSPLPTASNNDTIHDTFAQTGAYDDDLFDDATQMESMQTRPQDDLFADDFTPAAEPTIIEPAVPAMVERDVQQTSSRGRGRGRGKGRSQTTRQELESKQSSVKDTQPPPPENAPTGPRKENVSAVRGDRQATGGVRKPKLSEAELAEKMAQISIKNASLAAAHARAEADAASFADREAEAKIAASKRDEAVKARAQSERKDRQQMMGEREKNRLRKLKAMEGREWDAEKNEDDFSKGGRFDGKGFAGDQTGYSDGREYLLHEPKSNTRSVKDHRPPKQNDRAPTREEFPALPAMGAALSANLTDTSTDVVSSKSWAEQVEASAGA